ncbi:sulfurtransferase complex subunit TusD [Gallaecimonas sp. GXIMD4217]|uniref:sulfurtransferase complex subunit TusD n=1 Tax=Gallaecimonas sp. GXIMD4217 TaxID=3131927 RepID=UPI00311B0C6E
MATITILVSDAPWAALNYAKAALDAGHSLASVFFYQDAVAQISSLKVPVGDEPDLNKAWTALARQQGLELAVCVAAAERRGIVDEQASLDAGLTGHSLAEPFRLAGLGELVEATIHSDRTVQW